MRLIDADALKENAFFHEIDNVSYVEEEDIDNAPTVDAVERKRGKWKWNNDDELYYSCSCCGYKAYGNALEIIEGTYHFCPNCGADMREENR